VAWFGGEYCKINTKFKGGKRRCRLRRWSGFNENLSTDMYRGGTDFTARPNLGGEGQNSLGRGPGVGRGVARAKMTKKN